MATRSTTAAASVRPIVADPYAPIRRPSDRVRWSTGRIVRGPRVGVGTCCAWLVAVVIAARPTAAQVPAASPGANSEYIALPGATLLWPAGAPGALGSAPEDRPTVTTFLPDAAHASGAAMVVFPGGGYQHLAVDHEGIQVARWLNTQGIAAFVVQYRLGPRYHHPAMEQDALRAVRLVRSRATAWHVDPERVGVIGFSAGGHMAATVATRFGDSSGAPGVDAIDRLSARPNLAVLLYPVITMSGPLAHQGSRTNLLGPTPSSALERALSLETQVTRATPPTFVVSSTDDTVVPVDNSVLFYEALRAARVPAQLLVFETGQHGFGLAASDPVLSTWTTQCALWLGRHGFTRPASARTP